MTRKIADTLSAERLDSMQPAKACKAAIDHISAGKPDLEGIIVTKLGELLLADRGRGQISMSRPIQRLTGLCLIIMGAAKGNLCARSALDDLSAKELMTAVKSIKNDFDKGSACESRTAWNLIDKASQPPRVRKAKVSPA